MDGSTIEKGASVGLSPEKSLLNNDSYSFFKKIGDRVITGPTGTNVNDIAIAVMV